MSILTEGTHTGEYIASEANGSRSREAGYLAAGNDLSAGAVLGQVTTANAVTEEGANTGDGTVSAVTTGVDAINGTYVLTGKTEVVDGGTFSVVDPNGVALDDLTVDVAYVSSHINLTVADGAADWDIGDIISVEVIFGEYGVYNPAASDGSETAKAILYAAVDASSAETKCVVTARDSEVTGAELVWADTITSANKTAAAASLASVGIILR